MSFIINPIRKTRRSFKFKGSDDKLLHEISKLLLNESAKKFYLSVKDYYTKNKELTIKQRKALTLILYDYKFKS